MTFYLEGLRLRGTPGLAGPTPGWGARSKRPASNAIKSAAFCQCTSARPGQPSRFTAIQAPHPLEWLTDNGNPYPAKQTRDFAMAINLVPCFTPVQSPESNGISESFVKTFKRDGRITPCRMRSPLRQIAGWFEDYNDNHPHSALKLRSPRTDPSPNTIAECPVEQGQLHGRISATKDELTGAWLIGLVGAAPALSARERAQRKSGCGARSRTPQCFVVGGDGVAGANSAINGQPAGGHETRHSLLPPDVRSAWVLRSLR